MSNEADGKHKLLKMRYFQRKYKENAIFPLIRGIFLLYLQRILITAKPLTTSFVSSTREWQKERFTSN